MNKLTAEKCRELLKERHRQRDNGDISIGGNYTLQALEIALPILEQQERGEGGDDTFIVMRNPGKVPFIKRPTCNVAEYLAQLYQHNPEAVCEVITYRYAGASGQWVQDGRELLAELDIGVPAAMQGRGEGEWIEWGGGDCPVPGGTIVDVRYRSGQVEESACAWGWGRCPGTSEASSAAGAAFWENDSIDNDIIAYRIIPERATNQNGEQ